MGGVSWSWLPAKPPSKRISATRWSDPDGAGGDEEPPDGADRDPADVPPADADAPDDPADPADPSDGAAEDDADEPPAELVALLSEEVPLLAADDDAPAADGFEEVPEHAAAPKIRVKTQIHLVSFMRVGRAPRRSGSLPRAKGLY
ncbi:hypothetical protein ACFQ9X_47740 [Catenulispora yoronensis]